MNGWQPPENSKNHLKQNNAAAHVPGSAVSGVAPAEGWCTRELNKVFLPGIHFHSFVSSGVSVYVRFLGVAANDAAAATTSQCREWRRSTRDEISGEVENVCGLHNVAGTFFTVILEQTQRHRFYGDVCKIGNVARMLDKVDIFSLHHGQFRFLETVGSWSKVPYLS